MTYKELKVSCLSKRSQSLIGGFTLVEIMVALVIIGILVSIALPNYLGAQNRAKDASVKGNMRTAQIAAESFATDNGGTYPSAVDSAYESYFPGGLLDGKTPAPFLLVNPYSAQSEWPQLFQIARTVLQERAASPGSFAGAIGQVGYAPIGVGASGNSTSYAIEGVGGNGITLTGDAPNTTLVLNNN